MKNNRTIKYIIIMCLSLLLFIIYSDSQKKYFLEKDKFNDWIQFNTNGLLIIIGAFATIIAVIITINNNMKEKDKEVINRINRLKLIINLELNFFFESFEKELRRYYKSEVCRIKENIEQLTRQHKFQMEISEFDTTKVYKLNEKFNDYFYELILLDDNSKLINAIKIIDVKDVFNKNKHIDDKILSDIIKVFSSTVVVELESYINYNFKNSDWDVSGLDSLKNQLDKFNQSYEMFDQNDSLKSDTIEEVFEYLRDRN